MTTVRRKKSVSGSGQKETTADAVSSQAEKEESRKLGRRLRVMRHDRDWNLKDLSERSGIAISTLSKIENGTLALSYDRLIKVAQAFGLSLSEFITDVHESRPDGPNMVRGRFSLARPGSGERMENSNYNYEYLCSNLRSKVMTPVLAELKARTLEEFGPLSRHDGEEFVMVLSGTVEVHTELYSPETLEAGEGLYVDSGMGHAFLSVSDEPARILFVNAFGDSAPDPTKLNG
ncbi:MAG: XRE family transcriptional regulator [Erythrobacter sp.]|uniref:helix-turn-helix domain-containing protein n=1 Tax=Erythrobacter sp. TaxID=1042 RepID=UPI00262350AC|nr:XRE family transcriptional regulator [Erythrobacter sp.]MDJ0978176.1 XRE family transcriptional regulator [Erythrobacter sp.]